MSTWRPAASSRSPCTPNASLFKAPEIKRAVQGDQVAGRRDPARQLRERGPVLRARRHPVSRDVVRRAHTSSTRRRGRRSTSKLAKQGMKLLYTVPWPPQGIFTKRTLVGRRRHEGPQVARLQPRDVEDRRARRRAARHRPGGRGVAGARDRRHRLVHVVGRDRLRLEDLRAHQELLRHPGVAPEERGDRQPEGLRCARQADAGRGAQGRGGRRSSRLEALGGEERRGTSSSSRARAWRSSCRPSS